MKIAIVTQPCRHNYGGIMQSYAMQTILKSLGHTCTNIVPIEKRMPTFKWYYWRAWASVVKRSIKHLLNTAEPGTYIFTPDVSAPSRNTRRFINRHINIRYLKTWKNAAKGADAVLIGSDQVWRKAYNYNPPEVNFGSFAPNIPVITYAASWGLDYSEYTPEENTDIIPWIRQIDAISVREISGIDICRDVYGVDAVLMPDPTLLLTADQYLKLTKPTDIPFTEKYMMTYFLDNRDILDNFARNIAKNLNLSLYAAGSKIDDWEAPLIERIHPRIEEWIGGFSKSELILTDSFHGAVFSIIFNRPFFVIGNRRRGLSRMESLLETFGLQDRLLDQDRILDKKDDIPFDLSSLKVKDIDWHRVNQIREKLRDKGRNWLDSALTSATANHRTK